MYLIQSYANFKKACFQGNMPGEKEKKKKKKENTFKAIQIQFSLPYV